MPIGEALLEAIAQVESGNRPEAVGDAGLAIGAFQMQPVAYADVQRLYPEFRAIPYDRLRKDPLLQREAARKYLEAGQTAYGITDLDRLISFYNAGPRARRGTLINPGYVRKVKSRMGNRTLQRFQASRR